MNIVIFGGPGSGKGTQSEKMIERYGLNHISTGQVLRDHIARRTELGVIADQYISKGQLIPDDLIVELLADIFKNNAEILEKGVILDGFPRTIPQAVALEELLKTLNTEIHHVVGLEVDDEELVNRMILRGKTSGRADDNIETIRKRLDVYHNQTTPLKDFYIENGKYRRINGNGAIDNIFSEICTFLDK